MEKKSSILIKLYVMAVCHAALLFQACTYVKSDEGCGKFRSGDFVYNVRGPQGDFSYFISRHDSIQTETNSRTGDITTLSVIWIGECSYELRILESTANYPDSIAQIRKAMVLKNEIVDFTDDYYLFRSKQYHSDFILSDTLWIKK